MWKNVKELLPDYMLCNESSGECLLCRSGESVAEAAAKGMEAECIYADLSYLTDADVTPCVGKCRFVADSLAQLQRLNGIAATENAEGKLASVGLRLIPDAYGVGKTQGICESELAGLSAEIRKLSAISVRGCFVDGGIQGLHGKELGRYFRNCYELAKRMTVILPCAMPYICIVGGADAVLYQLKEHPESLQEFKKAAEIVAMQNNTAFYAKLLLT